MNRSAYITARKLAELRHSLSERDHHIITTLTRVRVATGAQLGRLHFSDVGHRQQRATLARLEALSVMARLPRTVGGVRAGSAGSVFVLGLAGQRLVRPDRRPHRSWNVGSMFLAHSLDVTELFVRLVEATRLGNAVRLPHFDTEPACWRPFFGPGGGRLVLKPDAAVMLMIGNYQDRWFIEVDRGTEATTTIARKCELYRRYWQTGAEQATTGVFPRVLWLVPDDRRLEQVVDVCSRQPAEAWRLFAVARFDQAVDRLLQGAGV